MRTNSFIFLVLLLLVLTGHAQDTIPKGKLDIGFLFSPDYSYRVLRSDASHAWIGEAYDTLEVSRFSYTAGFPLIYHVSQKLSLSTGLFFSDKGERTKNYAIRPVSNYVNHYYYLDVPLKLNYFLGDKNLKPKKAKVYLTAGAVINVFLNDRTTTQAGMSGDKKSVSLDQEISRITMSLVAGLGVDLPVTERWYFKLEPNYRRAVTSVSRTPVKKYFYSLGLNMGLLYQF